METRSGWVGMLSSLITRRRDPTKRLCILNHGKLRSNSMCTLFIPCPGSP
jgi:hypothetical protein